MGKQAVSAVQYAGAATFIAGPPGLSAIQTQTHFDLLEQQYATVSDAVATVAKEISTIEVGLDNAPTHWSRRHKFIGTLWHRWASVFIGVRYL